MFDAKKYREENKDKINFYAKKYRAAHRGKAVQYSREYYAENRALLLEDKKRDYKKNRPMILTKKRDYFKKNRIAILQKSANAWDYEKQKKRDAEYESKTGLTRYMRYRKSILLSQKKRRLVKKDTDITASWLGELKTGTKRCPLCNRKLASHGRLPNGKHLDHIIPISAGGKHVMGNVRYICATCNYHRPKDGRDLIKEVKQ